MTQEPAVREAYGRWAEAYADRFDDVLGVHPVDRAMFTALADLVERDGGGRVADLGCGPGHWTAFLHARGTDVVGIDLTPAFVARARRTHPAVAFEVGSIGALDLADSSLAGAVAWFSLIHTPPDEVPHLVAEIARVLAPGGRLLVGFQATDPGAVDPQPYDHTVTPGWRWPQEAFCSVLSDAGITTTTRVRREREAQERTSSEFLLGVRDVSGTASAG